MRRRLMKKVIDSVLKVQAYISGGICTYRISLDPEDLGTTPQVSIITKFNYINGRRTPSTTVASNYSYGNGVLQVGKSNANSNDNWILVTQTDDITITYKDQKVVISQIIVYYSITGDIDENTTITVTNADGSKTTITGDT